MSSFRPNRRLFLLSLAALAGCGFTPAFGPSGSANALMGTISIDDPRNLDDFNFVAQMEQRLGVASAPRFQLSYSIATKEEIVGLTPKQEIIRRQVVGDLSYTVRDVAAGRILTSGKLDNFTGYSVGVLDLTATPPQTSSTISTLSAQRDASERLMVALADQLVTRLIATAETWAQ